MMIDATFWVAISFLIFVFLLIYFKTPNKIKVILDENINKIKDQVDESEKLKEEAKNKLAEQERNLIAQSQKLIKCYRKQMNKLKKILLKQKIFFIIKWI